MNLNNEKYEDFILKHTKGHFLQSPEWAKLKDNWNHEVIIVKNEKQEIKGVMSILVRKIIPQLPFTIMYAPRGPVCDITDKEVLKQMTEEIKKIAKERKAIVFKMDPDVEKSNTEFANTLKELGYKIKENVTDYRQVIQPMYVFRIHLNGRSEEEVLASFNQKTRYNIRLAIKKGVTVREGKKEDLKKIYPIMQETGLRDDYGIRPLSYFEKMYDCMTEKYMKIFIAEYEGEPIAFVIPIIYGDKVWYLYGASSNKHRNLMPNYLLQWEMIKLAINNKCNIYDFRGVSGFKDENHPQYGIYKFKKGFNGDFTEFIGDVNYVFKPFLNYLMDQAYILRLKFRHLKRKLSEKKK